MGLESDSSLSDSMSKSIDDGRMISIKPQVLRVLGKVSDCFGVTQNTMQILRVILSNIRDYGLIKIDNFESNSKQFSPFAVINQVLAMQADIIEAKGISYEVEMSGLDFGTLVKSDESRLLQVALCLQSNAIKYTNEGSIKIKLALEKNYPF